MFEFLYNQEKGDTPRSVNNDSIDNTELKRASSTPAITDSAKQLKGKKVLVSRNINNDAKDHTT